MGRHATALRRAIATRGLREVAIRADLEPRRLHRWVHHEAELSPSARSRLIASLGLEGGAPDAPPWFEEAVARKDEMPLKELAEELGTSPTELANAFRAHGVKRTPQEGPRRRSGSKDHQIEKYFHLLGKVPDSEVARLSEVSVRTIASYRARNEIDGYKGPRRRPQPRGRRESKVSDFEDLLGRIPDRVVADIAGMSLGAVRNYRIKQDIPAAGRMRKGQIDKIVAEYRAGRLDEESTEDTAAPAPAAPAAPPPVLRQENLQAWRCTTTDESEGFIVVATNLAAAAARAVDAAGGEDRIAGLESLGRVVA